MGNLVLLIFVFIIIWGIKINLINKDLITRKILNFIIMSTFLFVLTTNEIFSLTSLFYNLSDIISKEFMPIGFLNAEISLTIFILNIIIALIVSIRIVGTIGLKETSRNALIKTIPFYLLTNILESYKYFSRQNELENFKYYGIGVILTSAALIILYSTRFIKVIFTSNSIKVEKTL